jgi:hypothetical protein
MGYLTSVGNFIRTNHSKIKVTWREVVPQLRRLLAGFPPRRPGFEPSSRYVGYLVDKVALGQVFSEYFEFPCQFSSHLLLHTYHLSSGVCTIG